ncbi:MAG: response regulator [Bacteroidota bacterium]
MAKSKILVVEDESIIADDLRMTLTSADYEVIGPFDNGNCALEALRENSVDLVLLDINIKGSLSGIDVAQNLEEGTPFIFVTSYYDDHTLKMAEKVGPSAYIVKPFRKEEVLINVRLALKKREPFATGESKELSSNYERIFVRDSGALKPVEGTQIMYAKGEDNYTRIMLENGKEYVISHTLKNVEEKLLDNYFCRVHKSYIININYVDMIIGNSLEISGKSIPIGKTYRADLFRLMQVL